MKRGKEEARELLRMFQKLFPYSRYFDLVPTLPVIPTYHAVRKREGNSQHQFQGLRDGYVFLYSSFIRGDPFNRRNHFSKY